MPKDSENIERIKRNYTEATLAHAESNLGDSPGIAPPAFKLQVQQNAFKASERSMVGQGSFQLKESGQESKKESKANSGASFIQNFQSKFNTDLSDVKVKPNSKEANKMGTKAFAKGNQIHFANGAYQPNSKQGQEVLGHELVHVLQQRKGMVNSEGLTNGHRANDNHKLEKEAIHQADSANKNGSVSNNLKGTKAGNIAQPVAQGFLGGLFKKAKKVAGKVGGAVKKGASAIGGGIKKVAGGIGGAIGGIASGIKGVGKYGFNGIKKVAGGIGGVIGGITSGIKGVGKLGMKGIKKVGGGIGGVLSGIKGGIMGVGKLGMKGLLKGRNAFRRGLGMGRMKFRRGLHRMRRLGRRGLHRMRHIGRRGLRGFRRGLHRMRRTGRRMGRRVRRGLSRVLHSGRRFGLRMKKGIGLAAGLVEEKISNTLPVALSFLAKMMGISGVGGKIKKLVGTLRKKVSSGVKQTTKSSGSGGLFGFIGKAFKSVGNVVGGVVKGVGGLIGGGIKKIIGTGAGLIGKVFSGVKGIAGKILGSSGGFLGGIMDKVLSGAESVAGFMGKMLSKGVDLAQGVANKGGGLIKKLFSGSKSLVKGLLQNGLNITQAVAQAVGGAVKKGIGGVFTAVGKIASDPIGGIKSLVEKLASSGGSVLKAAGGIGSAIVNKAKLILGVLKKRGGGLLSGIKETGLSIFGAIKSVVTGLGGGLLDIFKGDFKSGFGKMGMGVVGGITGTIDAIMDGTVGLLDSMFGEQGQEIDGKQIPKRHIMDEYCAHSIAYKDASALAAGTAMSAEEKEVMKKGGYDPDNMHVRIGSHGFQAVLIMPLDPDGGLKPMLAMRGTADLQGVLTDADPQQVGHHQFQNNKETIEAMIKMAGGKVDITGHSLGGAMAQITAAHFTSAIGRVTTFQSPGINKETAKLFSENVKKSKGKGPEVAHHTVKNDLVSKAGQVNLPGTGYEHDLGQINPLEAHTSWTSGTAGRRADRADYGMTDEFFNNQIGKEIYDESTITKFKTNPHIFKRALAEAVRSLAGTARDGAVGLFNLGKTGVSSAWNFMQKVQGGLKKASGPAKQLVMKFIKSGVSKKKQLMNLMSKIMGKMGGAAKSIIGNLR
jgi:phage-related protein